MSATSILHAIGMTRHGAVSGLLWISAALLAVLIICIARLYAAMVSSKRKRA